MILCMLVLMAACGGKGNGTGTNTANNETEPVTEPPVIKHQLFLDIEFEKNLLFSTYDVDVFVDEQFVVTLEHGENITKQIEVEEGEHEIRFVKNGDEDVYGTRRVNVLQDCTFSCKIAAKNSEVQINDSKIVDYITGSVFMIPDVSGKVLTDARKELEEIGFANVKSVSSDTSGIWDDANWTVVSQDPAAGTEYDKNAEIVLTCKKTKDRTNDLFNGVGINGIEEVASAEGISDIKYVRNKTKEDVSELIRGLSPEEREDWSIIEINTIRGKNDSIEVVVQYEGLVVIPDLQKKTLKQAKEELKALGIDNIKTQTDKGKGVSFLDDENDFTIVSQSVDAGASMKVTDTIELVCHEEGTFDEEEWDDRYFRAAVVAFTNGFATDVFAEDGNTLDPQKFHSFDDVSGDHFDIVFEGSWKQIGERRWEGKGIELKIYNGDTVLNAFDVVVKYDQGSFILEHADGTFALPGKESIGTPLSQFMELDTEHQYTVVPAALVEKDRSDREERNRNSSPQRSTTSQSTPKDDLTLEERNALRSAESYLNHMPFSRKELIEQLEYEGYEAETAKKVVDMMNVDWNEQAAEKAQSYLDFMSFSRKGLIEQLVYEGFTKEQAEYGVKAVGY